MGTKHSDSTCQDDPTPNSERDETQKDVVERAVREIIERERRNLQRASALLACLHVAAMYEDVEIDVDDVAYVVRRLIDEAVNALDSVEMRRAVNQLTDEQP